jgi:hypothetical protein
MLIFILATKSNLVVAIHFAVAGVHGCLLFCTTASFQYQKSQSLRTNDRILRLDYLY